MIRTTLFLINLLISLHAYSQSPSQITIGYRDSLFSKTLNEQRGLLIYLPAAYDMAMRYPVAYLLDAETHFHLFTGKWIDIVKREAFEEHGQIITFLKAKHGFTYGFANYVALQSRGTDARMAENTADLVDKQYKGKEHFRPLYEKLMAEIQTFGPDVEVAPKNVYVSLKRKKQFATLQPATKTRFEIGINLKGHEPEGR